MNTLPCPQITMDNHLRNRRSELLLTANHNNTIISITPTQTVFLPQDAQDPSSDLVNVAPGSTHNVTLNQFQTLLVFIIHMTSLALELYPTNHSL